MLLFADDRPRAARSPAGGSTLSDALGSFASLPALRWVVAGNALASIAASASQLDVAWLAAERGFSPERAALASGIVVTLAGVLGNPLIGALGDRWESRRAGGRLRCLAVVMAAVMPLAAGFYLLPSGSAPFYACWLAAQFALACWPGASSAVIQELAPARTRALVVAAAMVAVNLLGIGPGAWLAGAVGDARSLTAGLLTASAVGWLAVVPYLLSARRYPADRAQAARAA
jgi:predicted MFS family arabinose efflux permease